MVIRNDYFGNILFCGHISFR